MSNNPIDLKARARQAMLEEGFHPDYPAEVIREAKSPRAAAPPVAGVQDLRNLLWSSIDNDSSRDLDQVEYAEKLPNGDLRLLIGIADVDALVPRDSATDRRAATECTSVYAGVATFPMLPEEFSTDRTSLLETQERDALVIELHLRDTGEVTCHDVFRARLRNFAKLAYSSTGAWLEGRAPIPPAAARVPGMEAQLRLQEVIAVKLRAIRLQRGLMSFASLEATPLLQNGEVKDLTVSQQNAAEFLIECFMVAANVAMAQHLKERGAISLRRVVKTPKRWDRIQALAAGFGVKLPDTPEPKALADFLDQRRQAAPDQFPEVSLSVVKLLGPGEYIVEPAGQESTGHFGLAVQDYTHSTAPNRRYADLVTQRLLKATADSAPGPYTEIDLSAIAAHCTEREDAARKVERTMRKVVAASLLSSRVGEIFDGIITGASPKGTYVRLMKFPAEGMVVRGAQGVDVGDKVRVRLADVNVFKGFIDFERK